MLHNHVKCGEVTTAQRAKLVFNFHHLRCDEFAYFCLSGNLVKKLKDLGQSRVLEKGLPLIICSESKKK